MSNRRKRWETETDEVLMMEISQGNRLAFEILYDRYFDRLLWFAKGFLFDTQKAEDVVQEVFIRIMDHKKAFDHQRKFSTWAYTITGNLCKNQIRDESNRQRILQENQVYFPEGFSETMHPWDNEQLQIQLAMAKSELSANEKILLALRFEQELSIKEIAHIQNKPEGTIKSGLFYLLRKMAAHLKAFAHGR